MAPAAQSQVREASDVAVGRRKSYADLQNSEKLALRLLFQSTSKKMFAYSHPDVQKAALLKTYGRANASFFLESCAGWHAPVALDAGN